MKLGIGWVCIIPFKVVVEVKVTLLEIHLASAHLLMVVLLEETHVVKLLD